MNKDIKQILEKLEDEGYEAYIVGGFVRDKLLGKKSFDIDICTNALPMNLHEIFPNSTSNEYGGLYFSYKDYNIDITTYRHELKYVGRKPTEIEYINNLIDDIKRRDFTINSLCMNKKGQIIDLLDGKKDIKHRMINMIGNPVERILEDPLRILRGIRFACVLNFKISDDLVRTFKENSNLVTTLSNERIRGELNKVLLSKNFLYGLELLDKMNILSKLDIDYQDIKYSNDLLVMWSQLKCSDNLFTKSERNNIISIREIIDYGIIDEKMLYHYGLYLCMVTGEILGYSKKSVLKKYHDMDVNEDKKLDITSDEIMNILSIGPSSEIKDIKNELIDLILSKSLKNKKEDIIKYLTNRK